MTRNFKVVMYTPMGARNGTLKLDIRQSVAKGVLALFHNRMDVDGVVDGDGNCDLHGTFMTLIRKHPYNATGRIEKERIELTLCEGSRSYRLEGWEQEGEKA